MWLDHSNARIMSLVKLCINKFPSHPALVKARTMALKWEQRLHLDGWISLYWRIYIQVENPTLWLFNPDHLQIRPRCNFESWQYLHHTPTNNILMRVKKHYMQRVNCIKLTLTLTWLLALKLILIADGRRSPLAAFNLFMAALRSIIQVRSTEKIYSSGPRRDDFN
jgi:hypothetical protein